MRALSRGTRGDPVPRLPWQARHRARHGAPGPRAERRGAPGPVLRPHRAAPRGAPHDRRARAGHRPPHDIVHPFSRRRDARRRAAQRRGCCRPARSSSCACAPERLTDEIAAFVDDCWKPRPAARSRRRSRRRAPSGPSRSGARPPSARRGCSSAAASSGPATASATQWRTWRVEHLDGDLLERGLDGGDLGEDVDAVGVLVDHPLQTADLALDPAQPVVERARVGLHGASIPPAGTGIRYPAPSHGQSAGGKAAPPRRAARARTGGGRRCGAAQAAAVRRRRGARARRDRRRRGVRHRRASAAAEQRRRRQGPSVSAAAAT